MCLLLTGTLGCPAAVVTELKTMPQILSTQVVGVPFCAVGSLVLVAQGMVIQSVVQATEPTTEPRVGLPPVTLNDMAGVFTAILGFGIRITCYLFPDASEN